MCDAVVLYYDSLDVSTVHFSIVDVKAVGGGLSVFCCLFDAVSTTVAVSVAMLVKVGAVISQIPNLTVT